MLVVKRPFRNFGLRYTAGTVITDPASIKRLRGRIAEGKIIEVTEQTLETTRKYFKEKYGVDLVPDKASESSEVKKENTEPEVKEAPKAKTSVKPAAVAVSK